MGAVSAAHATLSLSSAGLPLYCYVARTLDSRVEPRIHDCLEFLRDGRLFRMRKAHRRRFAPYLRTALLLGLPLRFLSYWGIGRKPQCGEPEARAFEFLNGWLDTLSEIAGLDHTVEFLLTDTHAAINGIPPDTARDYAESTRRFLDAHGHRSQLMSEWMREHTNRDPAAWLESFAIDEADWRAVPHSWKSALERCAALRVNGDKPPAIAARQYYAVNLAESVLIAHFLPGHALISYQNPELDFLLPPLPKVYTYVGPKHRVRRPWFDEEAP